MGSPVIKTWSARLLASFSLKHARVFVQIKMGLSPLRTLRPSRIALCIAPEYIAVPPPIPSPPEELLFLLCPSASACWSEASSSHLFLQVTSIRVTSILFSDVLLGSSKILHDCCHSLNRLNLLLQIQMANINIVSQGPYIC